MTHSWRPAQGMSHSPQPEATRVARGVTSGPPARHTEAMPRPKHVPASDLRLPDALQPGRPKGAQLREILAGVATEAGPGRLMPSERFLAEHFGVARGTVRQENNRLGSNNNHNRQHG